ncbi:MAG: hypothetical protein Fur0032_21720 [Terrimicrobiaceae bacterium]
MKWTLPLRRLINENEPILLRNASSIYTLFVPQSARFEVRSCRLTLHFTNSVALLSDRSVLRVVMNDIIVGQYLLDRNNPSRKVAVEIPTRLLKDGFNRLQFIVAQHYTYKCEDPSAPELYTEIDPDSSFIEAVGVLKPVPMRLSHLRWWVDEKIWPTYRFNIGLPGARPMTDLHLAWGAIATQGVALARNYQPFQVNVSNGLREGMDNLIIGTMTELSAYLTATEVGSVNGGFLAIKPMPGDPNHCMVILSGRNEQEVGQTALAFGLVNYPLPDSQFATIERLALPNPAPYVRNAPLDLPGIYGFNQLGFRSRTIKGWNTGGFELPIYMPGDISRDDQSNAELRLHFAYGANMRKDSTFNVFINQQFQTAIRLSDQNGAMHNNHRLFLPMQALQPGRNVVSLLPKMVPMYSNFCEIVQDENLLFTLYEDSEFVFPKALRRARLPSLGLFSQTAFPFSAPPDGVETAICVAGKDEASVCAAWTVLGKIAQISGALLHRSEITFKLPRSQKSLLVVGPRDALPTELLERAPVSPMEVGRIRYVVSAIPKPQKIATSGIEEFLQKIRGGQVAKAEPEAPATAELNLTADLAEETVAIQYESPFHLGYPVTLITAGDSAMLLEGAQALQDRRIWDNLIGDLAVWSAKPDSLAVAKVGPDFIYKSTSVVTRVATRFDANPWLLGVVLVGTLAGLGWLAAWALRKREAQARSEGGGGGAQ